MEIEGKFYIYYILFLCIYSCIHEVLAKRNLANKVNIYIFFFYFVCFS